MNLCDAPWEVTSRLGAAAAMLNAWAPDVVALQEVRFPAGGGPSTARSLAHSLGLTVAIEQPFAQLANGDGTGNAVLTRLRTHETGSVRLPGEGGDSGCGLVYSWLESLTGRPTLVVSTQLAWGMRSEATRCKQVNLLDSTVRQQVNEHQHGWAMPENRGEPICVAAGSFNASATHDSVRWMTGRAVVEGTSADWTDAWEVPDAYPGALGRGHDAVPMHDGATVVPENPWHAFGAHAAGHAPFPVPRRRTDFVFIKGWARGVPGHPLRTLVLGADMGAPPSDHHAVLSDLWSPALPVPH